MPKFTLKKFVKYLLIGIPIALILWFFLLRPKQLTSLVRKVEVENRVVSRTVSASGQVKADEQANLTFISAGKISEILVEKGEDVKQGQLLAYLDGSTQFQTSQSYKDARDVTIRNKELYEKEKETNIKSLGGEDAYNIKLRQLNELVSQAEASYKAQLSILNNSYIYAPFDGTIIEVNKKAGETAVIGETVITLANMSKFTFEISIDQEDFGYIKLGQAAKINLDSYDSFDINTKIDQLPLTADSATGVFDIEIPITGDAEHGLAIGMSGDAYIDVLSTGKDVRALTIDEIFYDLSDNPYVWIVENGKLKKLYTELGVEGDIYTEIKTDVKEVVVPAEDNRKLTEGYFAKIIN